MGETIYEFESNQIAAKVAGVDDINLRSVEDSTGVDINLRGTQLCIVGQQSNIAKHLVESMVNYLHVNNELDDDWVERTHQMLKQDIGQPEKVYEKEIGKTYDGKPIVCKTLGQTKYVESIENSLVTFATGPAGTGKSWLAVAMAVKALKQKQVQKILLTRPAVEAGERLGYLPGDLMSKIDPYLRPLYDALSDMVGVEEMKALLADGIVEVAPLAFMRGRTLNNSFIILDEAQNTSSQQMKMFLTRIGFGSKAVVTGDVTQTDVTDSKSSLIGLEKILGDVEGVSFTALTSKDVVRHRIVQQIVDAYESNK